MQMFTVAESCDASQELQSQRWTGYDAYKTVWSIE